MLASGGEAFYAVYFLEVSCCWFYCWFGAAFSGLAFEVAACNSWRSPWRCETCLKVKSREDGRRAGGGFAVAEAALQMPSLAAIGRPVEMAGFHSKEELLYVTLEMFVGVWHLVVVVCVVLTVLGPWGSSKWISLFIRCRSAKYRDCRISSIG